MIDREKQELKDLLEDTARESGLSVKGEIAKLKTPEVKEAEREFENWKETKTKYNQVNEFKIPQELLNVLVKTNQHSGLIFSGEGGIGKTILTISYIKKILKPKEWSYSNGYVTPLALYDFLYDNRNNKVIILDDVEGIFNNGLSLSILKGALWESEGKRICQYSSKSGKANSPQKFVMNSKIIILCNSIPKSNDISTRALISRTISYQINFSFAQKMKMCKDFIRKDDSVKDKDKDYVVKLLEKHITLATNDFNFRTLKKIIAFVEFDRDKAEKLLIATTEINEIKVAYLKAIEKANVVRLQIAIFIELCGKGRATFFRIKKLMKDDIEKSRIVAQENDMVKTKTIKTQTDVRGLNKYGK